ncbi:MAG: prepilin-type N-terminal cleavage/methylation domain-containing protein [Candidatus Sumerlaeaceae bacterium]|nr:prepilin-type N-terminal cleavage/methylation domain-containing protein [Candidatus Sumerlaeaceae bacterium]
MTVSAHRSTCRGRGFTLLEVLVSLTILLVGIVPIVFLLPNTLRGRQEAQLETQAAVLAQQKAEEIRRDNDLAGSLTAAIAARQTPTQPIVFPHAPDLAYAFSGRSLLYTDSPRGDPGVPRVIIVKSDSIGAGVRPKDVVYELRFGY